MYPILFSIGGFEITSFGVMTAIGAFAGLWVLRHELAARGMSHAATAGWVGVFGGLLGAKLLYVAEHLGSEPLLTLLTSRGGMSWFGGLAGGIVAGVLTIWWNRWPLVPILAAATPAVALGQMFGRIGCFLVGDDYGLPTTLPWGWRFPRGSRPRLCPCIRRSSTRRSSSRCWPVCWSCGAGTGWETAYCWPATAWSRAPSASFSSSGA